MTSAALALLLAHVCAAEVSIQPTARECEVMWEINARNADRKGITLEAHTRKFNAMFKPAGAAQLERTRPWVVELTREGDRPASFRLDWDKHRPWWLRYVAAADAFLASWAAGTWRPLCRAAQDYGGRCDDDKGACDHTRACFRRVLCLRGKGRQAYWNVTQCRIDRRRRRR